MEQDNVNKPAHYMQAAITVEPIELTARLDACLGQAVNYIVRAPYKGNKVEDLQKAIFYLCKYQSLQRFRPNSDDIGETCFVIGSLFASQSKNENVRVILSRLFSARYISRTEINTTIKAIERWIKYGDASLEVRK